jgi:hypothetical protein
MTRDFCTLFDRNYLFKALVLHRSLLRHCPDFHLTAFCFDDEARRVIEALELPHLSTVGLDELEAFDADLLSVKPDRSPVEYLWTSTPSLPLYMFAARPELKETTYLDADLMFFSSPEPLFEEMGNASVLITPHRFSPELAHHAISGVYNVQFLTFRRDERGLEALNWWHDRCIEWCYYRLEDGKFGDQKYLDDWPQRFDGVHVPHHKGGGLAPWNITQYDVRGRAGQVFVDDDPLVFFHYHRVRLLLSGGYDWRPPGYFISAANKRLIYEPYLESLEEAKQTVWSIDPTFTSGLQPTPRLGERLRSARIRVATEVARRSRRARLRHGSSLFGSSAAESRPQRGDG